MFLQYCTRYVFVAIQIRLFSIFEYKLRQDNVEFCKLRMWEPKGEVIFKECHFQVVKAGFLWELAQAQRKAHSKELTKSIFLCPKFSLAIIINMH